MRRSRSYCELELDERGRNHRKGPRKACSTLTTRRRFALETLEPRLVLASFTVNGPGTEPDGDLDNPSCDTAPPGQPPENRCTFAAALGQAAHDGGGTINMAGQTGTDAATVNAGIMINGPGTISGALLALGPGSGLSELTITSSDIRIDSNSTVRMNMFTNSSFYINGDGNTVEENDFHNSPTEGIEIDCGSNNTISNNKVMNPDFFGMTIDAVQCTAAGNMIVDNVFQGASGTGLFVEGSGSTIRGNRLMSNGSGISVLGPNMTVQDNRVTGNTS